MSTDDEYSRGDNTSFYLYTSQKYFTISPGSFWHNNHARKFYVYPNGAVDSPYEGNIEGGVRLIS